MWYEERKEIEREVYVKEDRIGGKLWNFVAEDQLSDGDEARDLGRLMVKYNGGATDPLR
jgi:hypothetical protein